MINLLFLPTISCNNLLIQQVIEHIDNVIRSNLLIGLLALFFSIFLLTRGLKYKFLSLTCLVGLLLSSIHEMLMSISNNTFHNYYIWIIKHSYLPFIVCFVIAYFILKLFDLAVYILYLYLHFTLYDIVVNLNDNRFEIAFINTFFIILAFLSYMFIEGTTHILLAGIFSLFGSFGTLLSFQYIFNKDFGYLKIYKNFLYGTWDDYTLRALGVQILICTFGTIIQIKKHMQ